MYWMNVTTLGEAVVTVSGRLLSDGREIVGAALLVTEFDPPVSSQDELANTGLYLSEKFGPFAYIQSDGSQEGWFSVRLEAPGGRTMCRIGMRL
jgi:hypothetical protein